MSNDEGRKRGETEREFAERCKRLIVEWWQQNASVTPDVKIVSVDGDDNAIRSSINGYYPRASTIKELPHDLDTQHSR